MLWLIITQNTLPMRFLAWIWLELEMPPSIWRSFKCFACSCVHTNLPVHPIWMYVRVSHFCLWECGSRGSLPSHAVALNEQARPLHSTLAFVHLPVYKWLKVTGPDVTDRFRHTSIAPVSVWRGESLSRPAPCPLQDNTRMHEWISAAHILI